LLLLLLAAYPLIGALPSEAGSIRVAGLSALWWYGAVVAPALAWLVAVVLHR
jgi:tetrahydromethanopterin S-methyltransferase subunit B